MYKVLLRNIYEQRHHIIVASGQTSGSKKVAMWT